MKWKCNRQNPSSDMKAWGYKDTRKPCAVAGTQRHTFLLLFYYLHFFQDRRPIAIDHGCWESCCSCGIPAVLQQPLISTLNHLEQAPLLLLLYLAKPQQDGHQRAQQRKAGNCVRWGSQESLGGELPAFLLGQSLYHNSQQSSFLTSLFTSFLVSYLANQSAPASYPVLP